MRITAADIRLESQRTFVQKHERRESLRFWTGNQRPGFETTNTDLNTRLLNPDEQDLVELQGPRARRVGRRAAAKKAEDKEKDEILMEPKLKLLKDLMEKLLKKKVDIKTVDAEDFQGDPQQMAQVAQIAGGASGQAGGPPRQGFGLEYDFYESHYEAESTEFSAEGVVKTADGKEISFALDLAMKREYKTEENLSLRMGDALVDPLVLNFGGQAAELTDTRFDFDLDSDGTDESVSFLASNSGFLAFDRNQDGVINDGSELFGPSTGDGFAELARYDQDGNRFIDEGDDIYQKLSIYNKDAQGNDVLESLKDRNVGAIYLDSVSTEFRLEDENHEQKGQVRSSGVYLSEDATVGTVQQVDLSV